MTTPLARSRWQPLGTLFNAGTLGALSDPELLDCFRDDRGSTGQEAFRILVERHGPMVLGLCRSLIADPHEAEDAFQATFLVLVRKGHAIWVGTRSDRGSTASPAGSPGGRGGGRFSGNGARSRSSIDVADAKPERLDRSGAGRGTGHPGGDRRSPASLRAPIVLCALEGLSYDAAARQLGVREPTLRGRLHRARRRLATRLRERGSPRRWRSAPSSRFESGCPPCPRPCVQVDGPARGVVVVGQRPRGRGIRDPRIDRRAGPGRTPVHAHQHLQAAGDRRAPGRRHAGHRPVGPAGEALRATAASARPTARTQDQPAATADTGRSPRNSRPSSRTRGASAANPDPQVRDRGTHQHRRRTGLEGPGHLEGLEERPQGKGPLDHASDPQPQWYFQSP